MLRTEQEAEGAVPGKRITRVRKNAQPPGAGCGGLAQGALDGPAAALKEIAAGREQGGGEDDED